MRMARADKGYTLGAPGVWRQYLGGATITAVDAVTLSIDLAAPVADLLDILEQGFIVAPASLEAWDNGNHAEIIGSGAYRITRRSEDSATATRMPDHFASPVYETVTWLAEPDPKARLRLLAEGAVDIAMDLEKGAAVEATAQRFTLHDYTAPVAIIFLLNAARGPFSDPRVRRALSLAVDRPALVGDVMAGQATSLHGFISPAHFGSGSEEVPNDPDRARQLLRDAGFGGGLTLDVECPTRLPDEAEALCAALCVQLAQVGITLCVHIHEDREAYAHMVRRKEIRDMCVFDSSPMSTFRVLYEKIDARVAGSWWQGYHNARVEELLDKARTETSHDERGALYAEAYTSLQDDPAWLTLYTHMKCIGLSSDFLEHNMPADGILDVTDLPVLRTATG